MNIEKNSFKIGQGRLSSSSFKKCWIFFANYMVD